MKIFVNFLIAGKPIFEAHKPPASIYRLFEFGLFLSYHDKNMSICSFRKTSEPVSRCITWFTTDFQKKYIARTCKGKKNSRIEDQSKCYYPRIDAPDCPITSRSRSSIFSIFCLHSVGVNFLYCMSTCFFKSNYLFELLSCDYSLSLHHIRFRQAKQPRIRRHHLRERRIRRRKFPVFNALAIHRLQYQSR